MGSGLVPELLGTPKSLPRTGQAFAPRGQSEARKLRTTYLLRVASPTLANHFRADVSRSSSRKMQESLSNACRSNRTRGAADT
jgi:hypothetical protein